MDEFIVPVVGIIFVGAPAIVFGFVALMRHLGIKKKALELEEAKVELERDRIALEQRKLAIVDREIEQERLEGR
jgi:hypothetical protein